MTTDRIDESGLPIYAPGDYDYVRVVDRSTGASRNALAPEVTAAARAISTALDGLVADARENIDAIIRDLGYLPPVPYASGLSVNDIKFTVSYNGDVYAPKPELVPFTTGAWNADQWNVIQGDVNLRSDLADPAKGASEVAFRQAGTGTAPRDLRDKVRERKSVLDYSGALPGGVVDNTSVFRRIELEGEEPVDLVGGTYLITSYGQDTVNGLYLSRDYRNGALLVDGRPLVFDRGESARRSANVGPRLIQPATNKKIGVNRISENAYAFWRPLGGKNWARYGVSRTGSGIPFNWNETWLEQVLEFRTAEEGGVTYSGTTTPIGSGSASFYVNGRARRLDSVGAYVEVEIDGGGDIYVIFSARNDSGHVAVTLNGLQEYLTLLRDGSGNSYFDAYSNAVANKRVVQVASGVPIGSHTLRFTTLATRNPASSNNRLWFNAVGWDGDDTGPWKSTTSTKPWASEEAVLQNEERIHADRYYVAAGDGTTGATPPTHGSGSVSDGGVTWAYRGNLRGSSSYSLPSHRLQGAGSQLEYAYEIKPQGATDKEDVGGAAHGNETQRSFTLLQGHSPASAIDGGWLVGDVFSTVERISAHHSQIGGGATDVVDTMLTRTFSSEYVTVSHRHELLMPADVGFFYAAMWPLLHYNSVSGAYKYALKSLWSPSDGYRHAEDYYYTPGSPTYADDTAGCTKDLVQIGYGPAYTLDGTLGAPGDGPTGLEFVAWLQVDGESVMNWKGSSTTFCSKSMNMSDKNPITTPGDSMICKMYFQRHSASGYGYQAGEVIECTARYGLGLRAA